MTESYDLPDKFYDKMTTKKQLAYLRKNGIIPHPLKIDRGPQSTPHQKRISAAMRRLWRTRWKHRKRAQP
jgi:hypothetical protein